MVTPEVARLFWMVTALAVEPPSERRVLPMPMVWPDRFEAKSMVFVGLDEALTVLMAAASDPLPLELLLVTITWARTVAGPKQHNRQSRTVVRDVTAVKRAHGWSLLPRGWGAVRCGILINSMLLKWMELWRLIQPRAKDAVLDEKANKCSSLKNSPVVCAHRIRMYKNLNYFIFLANAGNIVNGKIESSALLC